MIASSASVKDPQRSVTNTASPTVVATGPSLNGTGPAGVALLRDSGPVGVAPFVNASARGDKLFKDHPLNGTYVLKSGEVVLTPYHAYDADAVLIVGTADLETARRLMGDKSYLQQVTVDGSRAMVTLLIANYRDTSLGPYKELVITTQVSNDQKNVSTKNPYALMKPLFDSEVIGHGHQLALNREARVPIAYGREILGLDKIPSDASVARRGATMSFDFRTPSGDTRMVGGEVTTDPSLWTRIKASFGFMRAVGVWKSMKFLWTRTVGWNTVSVDPDGSGLKRARALIKGMPTINRWHPSDRLDLGDAALGRTLRALDFKPLLTTHYAHGKFVLEGTKAIR